MKKIIIIPILLLICNLSFSQSTRTLNGTYSDGTFGKKIPDTVRTLIADGTTTTISSGGVSLVDTIKAIGGGGGTPASSNQTVQFNDSGVFGGDSANFIYGKTTHSLVVSGNVITPIIYGSTASGGSLTLHSTSNGTLGFIYLGSSTVTIDETNKRLGIGTITPSYDLDIVHTVNGVARAIITNSSTGTAGQTLYELANSSGTLIMGLLSTGFTPSGANIAGSSYFQSTGTQTLFRNLSGSWVWVTKPASTDIERWRIDFTTGNFSNTGSAGTAYIHLKAGTASAGTAPLKIADGTLLTTPESGAIETDGTHIYWTNSAGTRLQLDN